VFAQFTFSNLRGQFRPFVVSFLFLRGEALDFINDCVDFLVQDT
jgi:hypothetical protein